mgnify:CR=1 FL=1
MWSMNERIACLWPGLVLIATLMGCRPGSGEPQIHGTVTYQGAPVAQALLQFFPRDGRRPINAAVDDEGRYDPLPEPKRLLPARYGHRKRTPLAVSVPADGSFKHDLMLE